MWYVRGDAKLFDFGLAVEFDNDRTKNGTFKLTVRTVLITVYLRSMYYYVDFSRTSYTHYN